MRIFLMAIALVAPALLGSGLFATESGSEQRIRIAGSVYLGDLPTWVALDRELFASHGLDASVEFGTSGRRNLARLRAGDTDFALMALTPVLLDRLANAAPDPDEVVILASVAQSHELAAIIASTDKGISRPNDLRGRRVALERETSTEFLWWIFCRFHGIDPGSVETIDVPFSQMPDAIAAGRVDAAVIPEPWGSAVEARINGSDPGPLRRFDTRDIYAGEWVIATTRATVRDRPETCRRLLNAYREAIEFIERRPTDAMATYIRGIDLVDAIGPDRWQSLDYDLKLDWSIVANLQQQLRWAREAGYDSSGRPLNVLHMIATGPLLDVWPRAVNLPAGETATHRP